MTELRLGFSVTFSLAALAGSLAIFQNLPITGAGGAEW
jgi:hypothetical protein